MNVGVFIAAALLLDIALWLFILLGWEAVSIPADFIQSAPWRPASAGSGMRDAGIRMATPS